MTTQPAPNPLAPPATARPPEAAARPGRAIGTALGTGLAALLLAGCAGDANRAGLFSPYRISIPQGNYVTQEMLTQVKEGMTREQVRYVLGTPLVEDAFHPGRWDYVFRYQHPSGRADLRHATVEFASDRVSKVSSVDLPARDDPNDPALPGTGFSRETIMPGARIRR